MNEIYMVTVEDWSRVGGPMAHQETPIVGTFLFRFRENILPWIEKEFAGGDYAGVKALYQGRRTFPLGRAVDCGAYGVTVCRARFMDKVKPSGRRL